MSAVQRHEEQRRAVGGRRLYSLPQAREELAGISRATLDREIAAGEIAVVRIRSRRYITAEELERYIATRDSGGADETAQETREPDLGRAQSSRDDEVADAEPTRVA